MQFGIVFLGWFDLRSLTGDEALLARADGLLDQHVIKLSKPRRQRGSIEPTITHLRPGERRPPKIGTLQSFFVDLLPLISSEG